MSQTRKSPAGGPGHTAKNQSLDTDFTTFLHSAQQCHTCASCGYLKLVPLPAGGVRKVCIFTGERLGQPGKPSCEFIKAGAHE